MTGSSSATLPDPTAGAAGLLLERLLAAGLLVETGVKGLYGRSAVYQDLAGAVSALISRWGAQLGAVRLQFPPVLDRRTFGRTNYVESFPDLMGSVHVFRGGDREHKELLRRIEDGGDWSAMLQPAEVVLGSAACHAVYPLCGDRVPWEGRYFDVSSYCFRHEPSDHAARMQAFVMHELVYVGSAEGAVAHRDSGLARGLALLETLGLSMTAVAASDPFFGRVGTVLAADQLAGELKLEGVTTLAGDGSPTAVMSANCHRDHFGHAFGIMSGPGRPAHSSCVAFGVDRIVVALLSRHGLDPATWPGAVRSQLP
jgi:seryl-tRNA synthetase